MFIGVDPGVTGAIAWGDSVESVQVARFPSVKSQPDLVGLTEIFLKIPPGFYMYELVHAMPNQGVSSTFTFGKRYGILIGMFYSFNAFNTSELNFVSPRVWQKKVLGMSSSDKSIAANWCLENFPHINLYPGRCSKPHSGIADALCIWYYNYLENGN